ncbi:MAG: hypothetical protein WCN95_11255 [bacterium]
MHRKPHSALPAICIVFVAVLACINAGATPWPVNRARVPVPFDDPPKEMPSLELPKGATNLAAAKPVTSSTELPLIGLLAQITDGKRKDSDDTFVEIGSGKQYVQIDLKTNSALYAVWLWYRHPVESYVVPYDIVVRISSDTNFTEGATTVFNCDHDNSSGLGIGKDRHFASSRYGKLISFRPVKGRYVRVYSNGSSNSDTTSYVEIEVHGIPPPAQ